MFKFELFSLYTAYEKEKGAIYLCYLHKYTAMYALVISHFIRFVLCGMP